MRKAIYVPFKSISPISKVRGYGPLETLSVACGTLLFGLRGWPAEHRLRLPQAREDR